MKKSLLLVFGIIVVFVGVVVLFGAGGGQNPLQGGGSAPVAVEPVKHGSFVMDWSGSVIYVDPVGASSSYSGHESPEMVFITHAHPDHLDVNTLQDIVTTSTQLIVPQKVANQLPDQFSGQVSVINNGEMTSWGGLGIKAIPMYNVPTSTDAYHVKGDGNGYLLEKDGYRVYIAGDTSGTEEMRNLEDIDMAFVPMNLPYTMDVEEAADAVVDFSPEVVYPYHYRNQDDSLSDVEKFKDLVKSGNQDIEVRLLDWYPNR